MEKMMNKFSIQKVVVKQSKNGEWKAVELTDSDGKALTASVWPNAFADYVKVIEGAEVSGKIRSKGQYNNLVDEQDRPKSNSFASNPRSRASDIKEAVLQKEASIERHVAKKEEGMIYFSSIREAGQFMMYAQNAFDSDRFKKMKTQELYDEFWVWQKNFKRDIENQMPI